MTSRDLRSSDLLTLATVIQGPSARFGDTFFNAGMLYIIQNSDPTSTNSVLGILALLQSNSYLAELPSPVKTIFVSLGAASFRMVLTPIDTLKTTLQAQGARGTALLRERIRTDGIGSLWYGAFATAGATFVGNYPWFATVSTQLDVLKERC